MKNQEKKETNCRIEEPKFISDLRQKLLQGESIWYADIGLQLHFIGSMIKRNRMNIDGLFSEEAINLFFESHGPSGKRKHRRKNNPDTALHYRRYDEHHEFDVTDISEFKNRIKQRGKEEECRRKKRPDGSRQLPSKKEARLRKEYLQASQYKADEMLMAS